MWRKSTGFTGKSIYGVLEKKAAPMQSGVYAADTQIYFVNMQMLPLSPSF